MDATKPTCEIYSLSYKNHIYRWKWRYLNADGAPVSCAEEYVLFSDCVHAARASGYEARASWVRSALVAETAAEGQHA